MEVGIRELRNNLSRYLDRVKDGERVVVTDRGTPIAELAPLHARTTLERLIAEGKVTPAKQPKRPLRPPIKAKGTVSDLIAEQRR